MLKVTEVSYGFPQKDLYEKISFSLEAGEHGVLIGTNGTGKSTLFQLILDRKDALYDGKIELEEHSTIGYVSQFMEHSHDVEQTVFDYIMEPFVQKQREIDDICKQMETGEDIELLMEEYQKVWDSYEAMDGDNASVNIRKELKLAGIEELAELALGQISGGEFKLVQIIREMLLCPKLLMMDEPDAFLDFERLIGLGELINHHKGTLLVITHNRYLLNHCFNKVLHLENKELEEYEGTYPEYRLLTLETKVEQQAQRAKEQEEIDRNQKIVERMRNQATRVISASRGRALHARVSYLERLEKRQTPSPFLNVPEPKITLCSAMTVENQEEQTGEGKALLTVSPFEVGYEETLLRGEGFDLSMGEKIAFVGANGTGKTTLLRNIKEAFSGKKEFPIAFSKETKVAYLSQYQGETLNEGQTLSQCMEEHGIQDPKEAVELLARYTLSPELLDRTIGTLSGGEKNLFQLLLLSKSDANVLLLDEPTSHLDLYAQEALETALSQYRGAILMVCHDFYTIAGVADKVLYVRDGMVNLLAARTFRKKMYEGTFEASELEKENRKRQLEQRIQTCLEKSKTEEARNLLQELSENME